jgi:acyl-CoA thioesterase FadM
VIADGARDGSWECADPEDVAGLLVALIDGIGLHATLHPDAVPAERAGAWARRAAELELGIDLSAPAAPEPAPATAATERRMTLRRGERDAAGRLRHAAAAALLAEARCAWLDERVPGATVTRVAVEHRAAPVRGESVVAGVALAHLGRATIRTREELRCDGELLASAESTLRLERPLTAAEREALAR